MNGILGGIERASVSHEDETVRELGEDRVLAMEYLQQALDAGEASEVAKALRRVARAYGREEILGTDEYPSLQEVLATLRSLGVRLQVVPRGDGQSDG